jgi:hypothetical protein
MIKKEVFMQKAFVTTALGLLFNALASRPALAIGDELVRAHIPFEFHIAKTTLPPGDYRIQSAQDTDRAMLEIRNDDGRVGVFFLTEGADTSKRVDAARLVFDQIGQERFLHAILVPGDAGYELRVSAEESQAALAAARATAEGEKAAPSESGE